ncbi:MAG: hypothetical protein HKL82_02865 [Acidimicrobiaceae bacterium]|nr:hypothetical protein [Acidimicrobiaceae bacterium]
MNQPWSDRQWRLRSPSVWFSQFAYVFSVSAIATVGVTSGFHRILLVVASVLTLPCGLGALVGLYLLTGLFNWVAAGFTTASTSSGGCNPAGRCWSVGTPVGAHGVLFDSCIVLLFVAAAVANVLVVRAMLLRRWR